MKIILKPFGAMILLVVPTLVAVFTVYTSTRRNNAAPNGNPAPVETAASAPVQPVHLDPRSPVRNPSFEEIEGEKKPAGWDVDLAGNNAVNVAYVESLRGAHSGNLQLTNYGGSDYDVRTTQKITGLKNGKYTLRAWARNNLGGDTPGHMESYLVAKDFAGPDTRKDALIPRNESWKQVQVNDIVVTNGECVIGIYTKATGGLWTQIDDVELIPQD